MIPRNVKRARNLLIAALLAAMMVIVGVTGLYYWKGLQNLKPKDEYSTSYYTFF